MAKNCKHNRDVCPQCTQSHSISEYQTLDVTCVNCRHATEVIRVANTDYLRTALFQRLQQKTNYTNVYFKQ